MRKVRLEDVDGEPSRAAALDERVVHAEPMRVTLGDKLGDAASLRDKIVDDERVPTAAVARTRFARSLRTLDDTVRHSLREVLHALSGASAHGVAWLRAEARELGVGGQRGTSAITP